MSHCCPAYGKNFSFVKISGADLSEAHYCYSLMLSFLLAGLKARAAVLCRVFSSEIFQNHSLVKGKPKEARAKMCKRGHWSMV